LGIALDLQFGIIGDSITETGFVAVSDEVEMISTSELIQN